jgi:hypothetical protein
MTMFTAGPAVKINLSADKTGTFVYIDGVFINGVRSVKLEHTAGDVSRVTLEIFPSSLEIQGEATEAKIVMTPMTGETNHG